MTVDPDKVRVPGSGEAEGQVIFSPVMQRNVIAGFPTDAANLQAMGEPVYVKVKMTTPDCEDELVWDTQSSSDYACSEAPTVHECQVRGMAGLVRVESEKSSRNALFSQVTASSVQKELDFAAAFSVCGASGGTGKFWTPPIRTGYGWKEFLEYDLLAVTSLKKVQIGRPAQDNRDITRIRILTSLTSGYFEVCNQTWYTYTYDIK